MSGAAFSADALRLDAARAVDSITAAIRTQVFDELKRKGVVLGLSGGIDSSVTAALCAKALGRDRVTALLMPERDSAEESTALGRQVAESLGIACELEDITSMLEAAGCYRRRDDSIRQVIPEYGDDYRCKIVLPQLQQSAYRLFSVVAQAPDGRQITARLTPEAYRGIVAATNFKQRVRKMMEYYHADRLALRRGRHAQPPRIRPGLLREERRRGRRPEAHRPPVQDAGLPAGRAPRHRRGDPAAAAVHRHLFAGAVAGGVLLLAAVSRDGSLPVRTEPRRAGRGGGCGRPA